MLASLSKLAAGDAKHGPRLLLENLAALQPPVEALAALVPDVKAPAADLQGNLSRSRDKVVEEQLQACKLWPLLAFAGRLHVLLREVAPTEVQFQVRAACCETSQCCSAARGDGDWPSRADERTLLPGAMAGPMHACGLW